MYYIRKTKKGDIVQSLYVNYPLLHYCAGDIADVFTITEEPHLITDAVSFRDLITKYKEDGYKLRNYSETYKKRNRAEEKRNTDHGVYSIGLMMPENGKPKRGRKRVYGGMVEW